MSSVTKAFWWNQKPNIGDALNEYLITSYLKEGTLEWVDSGYSNSHFLCIGSILKYANKNSVIWGSGIISDSKKDLPKETPKKILSVRGPLTRSALINNGFTCPDRYGDPAILLSDIYMPDHFGDNEIGIIPHFVDKDRKILSKISKDPRIKIIDVETTDVVNFVNELCSCKYILSSSLHGLIIADSYNIPNLWVDMRGSRLWKSGIVGSGFKFRDYFLSVSRKNMSPTMLKGKNFEELISKCELGNLDLCKNNLLQTIPF